MLYIKTYLLIFILGTTYQLHAQRIIPMAMEIKEPHNNMEVPYRGTAILSVIIENRSSSEKLLAGDTVCFGMFGDPNVFATIILAEDLLPGGELLLDSLGLINNTYNSEGESEANLCFAVLGTANTSLNGSWTNPDYNSIYPCVRIILKGKNSNCNSTFSDITADACNEYLSPSGMYIWNTSGTYKDTLANSDGCDSVITVNLTVENLSAVIREENGELVAEAANVNYQWINCDNNTPINGATQQTYKPNTEGNYAVMVSSPKCTVTSECYNFKPGGAQHLNNITLSVFTAYPNPANNNLNIEFNISGTKQISIVNMYGQEVYTQTTEGQIIRLDVGSLAKGIYRIKVIDTYNALYEQSLSIVD